MDGRNPSATVDHKRGWQRFETAILIARFVVAEHNAIIDLFPGNERRDGFPSVLVHRNAQNFEPPVFILALKLREPRNLGRARAAPRGPEIQDHHLALIIREMHQPVSYTHLTLPT